MEATISWTIDDAETYTKCVRPFNVCWRVSKTEERFSLRVLPRAAVTLQGSVGRYRVTLSSRIAASTLNLGTFDDVEYTYVSPAHLGLDYWPSRLCA